MPQFLVITSSFSYGNLNKFYDAQLIVKRGPNHIIVTMGDYNAQVGTKKCKRNRVGNLWRLYDDVEIGNRQQRKMELQKQMKREKNSRERVTKCSSY